MLFFFLLLGIWQNSGAPGPCQVRLELQQRGNMLTMTGHCRNLLSTAANYRYELAMLRESNGNRSQSVQSGAFSISPQADVSLSQSSVNTGPRDVYRIHLRVFDMEGHTLSQDSAVHILTH